MTSSANKEDVEEVESKAYLSKHAQNEANKTLRSPEASAPRKQQQERKS